MTGGTRVGRPGSPQLTSEERAALNNRVASSSTNPKAKEMNDALTRILIAPTRDDSDHGGGDRFVVLKLTPDFLRFVESKVATLQALFENGEDEVQPDGRPAQLSVTASFECTSPMTVWEGLTRNTNGYWELRVDPWDAKVVFCEAAGYHKSVPIPVQDLVDTFTSQMPDEVVLYDPDSAPGTLEQRIRDFLDIVDYSPEERVMLLKALEPMESRLPEEQPYPKDIS